MTTWEHFQRDAPDLAERVRVRFAANLHHVLGTLRRDGGPRLSGTEVTIDAHHFRIGIMPRSHKLRDLLRDSRAEVHSAPLEEDLGGGDAKVSGRFVPAEPVDGGGQWFDFDIERVSLVQVAGVELVFTVWTPAGGVVEHRRR